MLKVVAILFQYIPGFHGRHYHTQSASGGVVYHRYFSPRRLLMTAYPTSILQPQDYLPGRHDEEDSCNVLFE